MNFRRPLNKPSTCRRATIVFLIVSAVGGMKSHAVCGAPPQQGAETKTEPRTPLLDDDESWARLPAVEARSDSRLPHWARALAGTLPRTTAAMLEIDWLYRTSNAVDPKLRAHMRWIAARANRCEYSQRYAEADMLRAGGAQQDVNRLAADPDRLPDDDRAALSFARKLTLDASAVTDAEMQSLIEKFGEQTVVAMVLQMAYANFQDRLLTTLAIPLEPDGPRPPLELRFARPSPDQKPEPAARPPLPENALTEAPSQISDLDWTSLDFGQLQGRMEEQRLRRSRVSVPAWDDVKGRIDPALYPPDRPSRIKWSLVVLGHQPALGSAWINCLRTFGREADQNRVFEESIFWVITRSLSCFY